MIINYKKIFGLILVTSTGVLLLAFLHWNPGPSSVVDIQLRMKSPIMKVQERKVQHTIGDYQDIAYNIKNNVARWDI